MRRLFLSAVLVLTAACTSGTGEGGPTTPPVPTPRSSSAPSSPAPATPQPDGTSAAALRTVPRFAHIVVVVEENHAAAQILGNPNAPYMNSLARSGVVLTRSYGVRHPSYPNYLALFSGSTHGITDDSCPHTYRGRNLGSQLRAHGLSFGGYAQGLPRAGFTGCFHGEYARKHAPWVDFANLPRSLSRPMSAFPQDYRKLPRVAFVIPDLDHDMHDGTVRQADRWLRDRLGGYVSWARTHNSLLILTWDEDDRSAGNHIPGVLVGAHLKPGRYDRRVDHYTMLRTIETAYGLPPLGRAADRAPITGIWTG